jgi:YegS C-terminal NAD kinase beta sandwich-like domain
VTIGRGEPWGTPVVRPGDLLVVDSDHDIAAAYLADPTRPVGLGGGDLYRSLGSPSPRHEAQRLPIDMMIVTLDDVERVAAAHVLIRRSWWRGPVTAVMNVDQLGDWNVAPRAHPNDGRLDVVELDSAMSVRRREQARRRLPSGTHVPHPLIRTRTTTGESWTSARPGPVWVDGIRIDGITTITVTVEPDAFAVVI